MTSDSIRGSFSFHQNLSPSVGIRPFVCVSHVLNRPRGFPLDKRITDISWWKRQSLLTE